MVVRAHGEQDGLNEVEELESWERTVRRENEFGNEAGVFGYGV